jgi:hypothetical protein
MRWWWKTLIVVLALVAAVALIMAISRPRPAAAQTSCVTNYTVGCIGSTVCFNATATSQIVIPQNLNRRYLLIQSQSTTLPLYFAIGTSTSAAPLSAVIGTNTIQLFPANSFPPNYEVSSLNATATPPPRVPSGAVAVITGGTSIPVCVTEANG